jgi:hypothetical protein
MHSAAPYLVMMLHVLPAAAQQPLETKLVIRQGSRETGREEFTLRQSRARGLPGTTIIAAARYPATAPTTQLSATLERTPEPALAKFELDVDRPDGCQGVGVRAGAPGWAGRGAVGRRGVLAVYGSGRPRHACRETADRDLPTNRTPDQLHGAAGAGSRRWHQGHSCRRYRRLTGDRCAGPARATRASGTRNSGRQGRVTPSQVVNPQFDRPIVAT